MENFLHCVHVVYFTSNDELENVPRSCDIIFNIVVLRLDDSV